MMLIETTVLTTLFTKLMLMETNIYYFNDKLYSNRSFQNSALQKRVKTKKVYKYDANRS